MRHVRRRKVQSPVSTSRRQFLGYTGTAVGASILLPFYSHFAAAQTAGFDYYISPTGSDANPGTIASPWAITAINTKRSVYAGRRVGLLDGTYTIVSAGVRYPATGSDICYDAALAIAPGTIANQTVIAAVNPQMAIIDGQSTPANNSQGAAVIGGGLPTIMPGYITLDGLVIRNCYYNGIFFGSSGFTDLPNARPKGLVIQNCTVDTVYNQTIRNENAAGIAVFWSEGLILRNNYVTRVASSDDRTAGIELWNAIGALVTQNSVVGAREANTGRVGPDIAIAFKNRYQRNNTVSYNFIDFSQGGTRGIGVDSDGDVTTSLTARNNLIVAPQPVFPVLMQIGSYPASEYNQAFFNNTLVSTAGGDWAAFQRYSAARRISFYNNIIVRTGSVSNLGDFQVNLSSLALCDYNCFPSSPRLTLAADGTFYTPVDSYLALSLWRAALGLLNPACVGKDANSIAADPLFVGGSGAAAYQLQNGSPCKNTGRSNGMPSGTPTDMGAWGNGATQVGCSFTASGSPPAPPVMTVS